MKRLQMMALAVLSLALLAGAADGQKKPVKKTSAKTTTTIAPLDVRAAREKVEVQLANVKLFVDKLGPIAVGIEELNQANAVKRLPQETYNKHEANKEKVIATIRNLRAGLSDLESEFRTKPLLKKYLPNIQGITDLAGESEDAALAGRFVSAKEPLRGVSTKLTDTLAVMPR